MRSAGRIMVKMPGHPRANSRGWIYEHIAVVERALGHILPDGAEVHHFDGDMIHNENYNLVACQDRGFHRLLHQRARALAASGHACWRKCHYCKKYVPPEELYIQGKNARHVSCHNAYKRRKKMDEGDESIT